MPVNWSPTVYPTGAVPGQVSPAPNRLLGRLDGGHPTGASFLVGDWSIDYTTPGIWLCTVAGSPGTWINALAAGSAVSSVFTRTGAVVATTGDYAVAQVTGAAPIASPTFTGTTTAPEFSASGLTGATAASRYVGATASGAPASGTFAVGDFIIDQTGKVFICTTAGTPGTWTQIGGGAAAGTILALKVYRPGSDTQTYNVTSGTLADIDATNLAVTFTAPASGNVIVRVTATIHQASGVNNFFGLRESTTILAPVQLVTASASAVAVSVPLYVSGISAGSHTYKWAGSQDGAGAIAMFGGPTFGAFTMEVVAAP